MILSSRRRLPAACLLALAILVPTALAAARRAVVAVPFAAPAWNGPQFLGADRGGRVFLLRADDDLAVYPLLPGGRVGSPTRLQPSGVLEGQVTQAAMGGDGDWLLCAGDPHLFEDGREKPLPPLSWQLTSLALDRHSTPIAGVVPVHFGPLAESEDLNEPPLVLRAEGRQWNTLLKGSATRPVPGRQFVDVLFAQNTTKLAAVFGGRSDLWVVRPFAGRATRLSPAGRPEVEIVLGEGKPRFREDAAQVQQRFAEQAAKAGYRPSEDTNLIAFTARLLIRGVTVDRDGTLYLLQSSRPGESLLTRYEPARGVVESLPVRLPNDGEEVSLAAGRDGLYIATVNNAEGRWRIDRQVLDEATWEETPAARVLTTDPITGLR